MTRKNRIILILLIGALVGGLVIAMPLLGIGEASGPSIWHRLSCVCDDLFVKLGLRSPPPPKRSMKYMNAISRQVAANDCIANLERIESAKAIWPLEHSPRSSEAAATELFGEHGYRCPDGGKYVIGSMTEKARCSLPGHTL